MMNTNTVLVNQEKQEHELDADTEVADPINDIIDYLVRAANISFKNAHVNETEIRTSDKIRMATEFYKASPTDFLFQFGKFLTPYHVEYFEKLSQLPSGTHSFRQCIQYLKTYHSEASRHKRVKNRRYKALQQLQTESDYFSEKEMMLRNPLLYEQLVGQYMTDDEIKERDGIDNDNLTLLTMILDTVDRNNMTQTKNEQLLEEGLEAVDINEGEPKQEPVSKQWGDFDIPDTKPSFKPEVRKQKMVSAPERRLLKEEFYQEMYNSFLEGYDDYDYSSVDNNEQYDDLEQVSQDEEDKYFDSETNEVENLEEHMKLVQEYGRRNSCNSMGDTDPLDVFMEHLSNKLQT